MKLEDIPKKQPFQMPTEAHFDSISDKIYAQIEKEEQHQNPNKTSTSVSIDSIKKETKSSPAFWKKPQFIGIAASILLLFVVLLGINKYDYTYLENITNLSTTQKIDFSEVSTQQIQDFLLDEDISESEVVSFMPENSDLEKTNIFEESDLNSIDSESLDLMLEEEYL